MGWLYECNADNSARYILGTEGKDPLICFGINPSTAEPNKLDPTVNYVNKIAHANGFDSFVMLNVYPQRATNPNDLHKILCPELKADNEHHIATLIDGREFSVWAAWGGNINKRPYLETLINCIIHMPELCNCKWISRGTATRDGHPHHPLYVKMDAPFTPFDIALYKINPSY